MPKKAVKPQELSVRLQPIVSARTASRMEELMKSWNTKVGRTLDILLMEHDTLENFRNVLVTAFTESDLQSAVTRFKEDISDINDIIKLEQ